MKKIIFLLCVFSAAIFNAVAEEVTSTSINYHTGSVATAGCDVCSMSLLLTGSPPDKLIVEDDLIQDYWSSTIPADELHYYSVKSVIEFGIDWTADYYDATPFGARLVADVTYWDDTDSYPLGGSTETITLEIVYDANSQMRVKSVDNYVFSKGLYFEVSATSLTYYDPTFTTVRTGYDPKNVYLNGYVIAERYRELDVTTPFSFVQEAFTCGDDRITVSWDDITGAEEYELMWTFVNAGAVPQDYTFINNHTKIITKATSYAIPVIYEKGTIVYTVRAVGRNVDTPTELVYSTEWSIGNANLAGSLSGLSDHTIEMVESGVGDCPGFEENKNWQYSASFAEEGKSKDVISYFDGTLRKRQTVARNNTDEKAIVANTIYDSQGRPAIETLPVPDMATSPADISLDYHELFTISDHSNNPYDYTDFDYDSDPCEAPTYPMKNSAGPGKYYSDQNPVQTNENAFLPDAQQYPFVQTEYTPDNTGRIRSKGGAGADHQLGTGHETKYFYGMPLQPQLDRLFANDVGYANHYTKEMVMDPNGTISVTYKNASGKVIATALAGDPTNSPGLIGLESSADPAVETHANLMDFSSRPSADLLTVNHTQLVTSEGDYDFHYEVTRQTFNDECIGELCFDCVYDLVISIKDECGLEQIAGGPVVATLGEPNTDCDDSGELAFEVTPDPLTVHLEVGAYTITKTLRLSSSAARYYLQQFIENNTCLTTLETFTNNAIAEIDFSGCGMDCDECLAKLGEYEGHYDDPDKADPSNEEEYEEGYIYLTYEQYLAAQAECESLCLEGISPCDAYKQTMLADMSPGGQYAPFSYEHDPYNDETSITGYATDDEYSYMSSSPATGVSTFSNVLAAISDYLGDNNSILIEGVNTPIVDLDRAQFFEYWRNEWAEALLQFHPEYCYYLFCTGNETSFAYDRAITVTTTFADAEAAGYLDPLNYNGTFTNGSDPFFAPYSGTTFTDMKSLMDDFPASSGVSSGYDIWELAALAQMNGATTDICAGDGYWNIFKGLYLALKQQAVQEAMLGAAEAQDEYSPVDPPAEPLPTDGDCPQFAIPEGKTPRFFMSVQEMYEQGGIADEVEGLNNALPDEDAAITYMNSLMPEHYENQCEGYAQQWVSNMLPCKPAYSSEIWFDEAEWNMDWTTRINHLVDQLVEICTAGSSPENPFGASSCNPGEPGLEYHTFEDALAGFFQTWPDVTISPDCNPHMITTLQPQGQNNMGGSYVALDQCACDNIYELIAGYNTLESEDDLPAGVCTMDEYFAAEYGVPPGFDIQAAMRDCRSQGFTSNYSNEFFNCAPLTVIFDLFLVDQSLPPTTHFTAIDLGDFHDFANDYLLTHAGGTTPPSYTLLEYYLSATKCFGDAPTSDPGTVTTTTGITFTDIIYLAATFDDGILVTDPTQFPDFVDAVNGAYAVSLNATDYAELLYAARSNTVSDYTLPNHTMLNNLRAFVAELVDNDALLSPAEKINDYTSDGFFDEVFGTTICDKWSSADHYFEQSDTTMAAYIVEPGGGDSVKITWSYPLDYYGDNYQRFFTSVWANHDIDDVTFGFINAYGGDFNPDSLFTEDVDAGLTYTHPVYVTTDPESDSLVFNMFSRINTGAWDTLSVRVALPNLRGDNAATHNDPVLGMYLVDSCTAGDIPVAEMQVAYELFKLDDELAWEDIDTVLSIHYVGTSEDLTTELANMYAKSKHRHGDESYFSFTCVTAADDTVTIYGSTGTMHVDEKRDGVAGLPGTQVPASLACEHCFDCADLLNNWFSFMSNLDPNYDFFADEDQPMVNLAYLQAFSNYLNSTTTNNNFTPDLIQQLYGGCFRTSTDVPSGLATTGFGLINTLLAASDPGYSSTFSASPYATDLGTLGYTPEGGCSPEVTVATTTYAPAQANMITINISNGCAYNAFANIVFDPGVSASEIVSVGDVLDIIWNNADAATDRYFRVELNLVSGGPIAGMLYTSFQLGEAHISDTLYELCPRPMMPEPEADVENDCMDYLISVAQSNAIMQHSEYINTQSTQFLSDYTSTCMQPEEAFTMIYGDKEYHFTLYYYDQAGNLVKTVPPEGVRFVELDDIVTGSTTVQDVIDAYRDGSSGTRVETDHIFNSTYVVNTLNQVTEEITPDAGTKRIWYDRLGRPIISQTAQQAAEYAFTHTQYDEQGRPSTVQRATFDPGDLPTPWPPTAANAWDQNTLVDWVDGADITYTEQIATVYDVPLFNIPGFVQQNLRGRVSSVVRNESGFLDFFNIRYDFATHYSYDIHGNVKTIVHDIPLLQPFDNRYFRIDYEYDLISGNVKQVWYQHGKPDQFTHKYTYDADNRIAQVFTSTDGVIWHNDAEYDYYAHGPLARTELGDIKVQGTDNAYTIQGWMKAVNAGSLNSTRDMGQDGEDPLNSAKDAMGFTLGYYNGDYTGIGGSAMDIDPEIADSYLTASLDDGLFNSNITRMVTALMGTDREAMPVAGNVYQYDQLNRIKNKTAYLNPDMHLASGTYANTWDGIAAADEYYEEFSYDANGNILTLLRNGEDGTESMDDLTYTYNTDPNGSNQLNYVDDAVIASSYTDDIEPQSADNYTYDANGNLIADVAEEIDNIDWDNYGKIRGIERNALSTTSDLEFGYDCSGKKALKKETQADDDILYTFYIRDAQDNVTATYDVQPNGMIYELHLKEQMLYGNSRIGILSHDVMVGESETPIDLIASDPESEIVFEDVFYDYEHPPTETSITDPFIEPGNDFLWPKHYGDKRYELSNHLSNVLSVITDRKVPIEGGTSGTIGFYKPWVLSVSDLYAFGSLMPGRNQDSDKYRYGFNGQEKDDELNGIGNTYNFTYRMYDSRLGRFFSVDPLTNRFPFYSPYHFSSNSPIAAVDIEGLETSAVLNYAEGTIYIENSSVTVIQLGEVNKSRYFVTIGPRSPNTSTAAGELWSVKLVGNYPGVGQDAYVNFIIGPPVPTPNTCVTYTDVYKRRIIKGSPPVDAINDWLYTSKAGGDISVGKGYSDAVIRGIDWTDPNIRKNYEDQALDRLTAGIDQLIGKKINSVAYDFSHALPDNQLKDQVLSRLQSAYPKINFVETMVYDAIIGFGINYEKTPGRPGTPDKYEYIKGERIETTVGDGTDSSVPGLDIQEE